MTILDIVDSCAYGTMSRNSKAYDQKFKENVINYVLEHPEEKYTALGNKFRCSSYNDCWVDETISQQ